MSYFPLDRDLLTSSTWATGSPEAIKVWVYLLLQADPRTGIVEDAAPAIALRCGLSLEATEAALDWLASPDPHSRTKDKQGRRIEALPDGGYEIVNYLTRQKKDHSTVRVRKWREMKRDVTVKRVSSLPGTTDKDTDTDTGTEGRKEPPSLPPADRTERAIRLSKEALHTKLYALVDEAVRIDPKHRDPTELMRLFTGYDKPDGTVVRGVVNAALLTYERLERSIADAETQLAEWKNGTGSRP